MNGQLPVMEILFALGAVVGVAGGFLRYRPRTTGARVLTVAAGAVAGLLAAAFTMSMVFLGALFLSFVAPMSDLEMLVLGALLLIAVGFPFGFGLARPGRRRGKPPRPFWWPGPDPE